MADPTTAAAIRARQTRYQATWRAKNPDRATAQAKRHWQRTIADPERHEVVLRRQRQYREQDRAENLRRQCPDCEHWFDASPTFFYPKGKRRDGTVRLDTYCKRCRGARSARAYGAIKADPDRWERRKAQARKWRANEWRATVADHERHDRRRAQHRAWYAAHRDDALIAARFRIEGRKRIVTTAAFAYVAPPITVNGGAHAGKLLDARPLADWIVREFGGWETGQVARHCGVNEATVRRILSGEQRRVSLHVLDRIFVAADCTHLLAVLYPLDA